jgi:hypothetical protein
MKRQTGLAVVVAVALSVLGAAKATADVVYTYTGNVFDYFTPGSPYSYSDKVTVSLTLATALGDNLSESVPVVATSFSFSDGLQKITNLTANYSFFGFSTDSIGNITQWVVAAGSSLGTIDTLNFNGYGFGVGSEDSGCNSFGQCGSNEASSRFWTTGSQTPLPGALPLFAAGLGALGLLGWRRKRKNAIAA